MMPTSIPAISTFAWWESRRWDYNRGLIVAGILAFGAYVLIGFTFLPVDAEFEVTIFTTLFQGIGYLILMAIANICYFLGPLSERLVRPENPESYRNVCYRLGFWFSVLLPFSIPALLVMSVAFIFLVGHMSN